MFTFFFFQAEDGIRDSSVTGVQTCALPICLHAGLAADTARAVEVHDAIGPPVEGDGGADRHAGRRVAVVAAQDREVSPRVREGPALHVLHPGAEGAERHLVLLLARDGAGVAADAPPLVDHEAVAHGYLPSRSAQTRRAVSTSRTKSATRSPKGDSRWLTTAPSCAPGIVPATTARVGASGIWAVTSLPRKPDEAATATIASELPIVTRIDTSTMTRKSGTSRNPPPAPTRPAARPMTPATPAARHRLKLTGASPSRAASPPAPTNTSAAAPVTMSAKTVSNARSLASFEARAPMNDPTAIAAPPTQTSWVFTAP